LASVSTGNGLGTKEIAQVPVPAPESELMSDAGSGSETAGLETGLGSAGVDLALASTGSDVCVEEIAPVSATAPEGELASNASLARRRWG
jgi:hypothetical protein